MKPSKAEPIVCLFSLELMQWSWHGRVWVFMHCIFGTLSGSQNMQNIGPDMQQYVKMVRRNSTTAYVIAWGNILHIPPNAMAWCVITTWWILVRNNNTREVMELVVCFEKSCTHYSHYNLGCPRF